MIQYFAPRAAAALQLVTTGTREVLTAAQTGLEITPNPAGEWVQLASHPDYPMLALQLFDISGRLIRSYNQLDSNRYKIQRNGLPTGTYIARIRFVAGFASQKIIYR